MIAQKQVVVVVVVVAALDEEEVCLVCPTWMAGGSLACFLSFFLATHALQHSSFLFANHLN